MDKHFENLKEKLFGGMKNDPKVRKEFLNNLKKKSGEEELKRNKLEEERERAELYAICPPQI